VPAKGHISSTIEGKKFLGSWLSERYRSLAPPFRKALAKGWHGFEQAALFMRRDMRVSGIEREERLQGPHGSRDMWLGLPVHRACPL